MQIVVYMTHERFYGTRSTHEQLLDELRGLALAPVLKLLAALNDHLRPKETNSRISLQQTLLSLFFTNDELQRMVDLDHFSRPVVLHRQQLLFLMKEALLVCPDKGLNIEDNLRLLGKPLLRANDLLAHTYPKLPSLRHSALVVAAHSFGIQEAGAFHSFEYKMVRSFWILQKLLPSLAKSGQFFDVDNLFRAETNLSLMDFHILQYMTMMAFFKEITRNRPTSPIELPGTWFRNTTFSSDVIESFLSYVSASPDELKPKITVQREPSDFTAFREAPLLRLDGRLILLDFNFLCEKSESGPFWAVRRQIPDEESNGYFSFWGNLFESYISNILQLGADPKFNQVIPDPRFTEDDTQFTDCAVLSGDALLMIEAKISTISAKVKYGADLSRLEDTLQHNLVEKALHQIVSGIKKLFQHARQVSGIQPNNICRIFPIIVTRDEVGATAGINVFLNYEFQKLMRKEKILISQSVTPLICLSAEDIERISPYGKQIRFDKVMESYFKGCKRDNVELKPFMLTPNNVLKSVRKKETIGIFGETVHELGRLAEEHMTTDQEVTNCGG